MVEENTCVGDKCMAPHDDGGVAMDDETLLNNKNNIVTRLVVLCFCCLGALVYYIKQTQRQKLLKEKAEMELLMVGQGEESKGKSEGIIRGAEKYTATHKKIKFD